MEFSWRWNGWRWNGWTNDDASGRLGLLDDAGIMEELIRNLLALQTLEFSQAPAANAAALIAELRGKIAPQILVHHDRLRVRGKKGLAAVRNQVCTGCHMRLPLAVIMTLKHGQDMQLCDNCGRYLYLLDLAQSPPPTDLPAAKPVRSARRRKKTAGTPEGATMAPVLPPAAPAQPRINPE